MFVAPCPHCGDSVTVPARARPASRVRCPLCTTEFTLDEMMAKLPPTLELLDEPAGGYADMERSYAAHEGGDSDVATLVAAGSGDDIALADAELRAEKPSYSFDAAGGGTATAEAPRKTVRTTPRPKKPPKNMMLEGVKIILGGVMALPISQLILWWAAGKDPFDLGPVIANNVPQIAFVVPEKLRKGATVKKPSNGATADTGTKPPARNDSRPAGLPKLDNNEMPKLEFPTDPTATLPTEDPLAIPKIDIDPLALPGEDKKAGALDPAPLTEPTIDPLAEPSPVPAPAAAPMAAEVVRDAPQYTAAEVEEAAKNSAKAAQTWTEGAPTATAEQKADLLRALYISLAQLGEKVAFANRADTKLENHLPTVREILFSLQAESDAMTMVTRVGPVWLNPQTRKSDGILLIGTVKGVTPQGKAFETTVELEDKAKTKVAIITTNDPSESYKADDRVMVLGVIVSEPSNIVGYEGSAPLAILSGMAVRVAQ